jgi:hypothetical protein
LLVALFSSLAFLSRILSGSRHWTFASITFILSPSLSHPHSYLVPFHSTPHSSTTTNLLSSATPLPPRPQVSADGTLRVWEQSTLLQLYEFSAAGEVATCLAYHPRADRHLLACGFARGHLRVFDVASTRTLVEYQVCALSLQYDGSSFN